MKKAHLLVLLASMAMAQPRNGHRHGHAHHRLHEREIEARQATVTSSNVVIVPGPTVITYVLDGRPISAAEVQEGLKNGTLVYAKNGAVVPSSVVKAVATPAPAPPSSVSPVAVSSAAPSSSSAASAPSAPASSNNNGNSANIWSSPSVGQGLEQEFPDGQIDCGDFTSLVSYGALHAGWLGLGGWTGVQSPGSSGGGYNNIMTVDSSTCPNGENCCAEGMFCAYACPVGYLKAHWPTEQGATGQSVGGLLCQNGKLQRTNPNFNTLCVPSAPQVNVYVRNNLTGDVPICRTDYPGTESMTIPALAQSNNDVLLAMPDEATYYQHEGSSTSAQYYVNPMGTSVETACQWGSSGSNVGNWAPLNLGVGFSAGQAWLGILQNSPTTQAPLGFRVDIVADSGLNGQCYYDGNGNFCSNGNCQPIGSATTPGCTASVASGNVYFVLSNA